MTVCDEKKIWKKYLKTGDNEVIIEIPYPSGDWKKELKDAFKAAFNDRD